MDLFLQILYTLLFLSALIFLHEFGHFITAKIFKIRVNEFSLGMGPKFLSVKDGKVTSIFSKKKTEEDPTAGSTRYSLRLFPIGGFVSMEGEDGENKHPDSFVNKPAWQRFIVIIAGGFMNLLTAFVLTLIVVSQTYMLSTTVGGFQDYATSNQYGLQKEDVILAVNGVTISHYADFQYAFQTAIELDEVDVVVRRDGQEITLENVRFPKIYMVSGELVTEESEAKLKAEGKTQAKMMYLDVKVYGEKPTAADLIPETFKTMWSNVKTVYGTLSDLITGRLSTGYVSGPIGLSTSIKQAADFGPLVFMDLAAMISVNLALVNLLPLPALDGGRAAILFVEWVSRKKVPANTEAMIHGIGMLLLLALTAMIAFKDIFFPLK